MKRTIGILLIAFASCTSINLQDIIINPFNTVEKVLCLSDFTDDITYIPLDNEIIFQHPNRIETTKDHFIIKVFPGGIMAFDRKGNFISKIGAQGRGPGEYQFGLFYTKNSEREHIYIYDNQKIIIYTFCGEFVREFSIAKFEDRFYDIKYLHGKLYLAGVIQHGYAKYNWLIIDTLGHLYSYKHNTKPRFESTRGSYGGFFIQSDDIFYWNSYNDTIYKIYNSTYKPSFLFAQGDFRLPHRNIPREDNRKYFEPRSIISTSKCIFISYDFEYYQYCAYVNRNDGKMTVIGKTTSLSGFDMPGISNDIDGGPDFPPYYYYQENHNEYLISWVHSYHLKAHVKSESFKNYTPKYPKKKKELEELAASLDENNNPILMLVRLKK